jgi:hypothetical protein
VICDGASHDLRFSTNSSLTAGVAWIDKFQHWHSVDPGMDLTLASTGDRFSQTNRFIRLESMNGKEGRPWAQLQTMLRHPVKMPVQKSQKQPLPEKDGHPRAYGGSILANAV